jgi:hypothetical protein
VRRRERGGNRSPRRSTGPTEQQGDRIGHAVAGSLLHAQSQPGREAAYPRAIPATMVDDWISHDLIDRCGVSPEAKDRHLDTESLY